MKKVNKFIENNLLGLLITIFLVGILSLVLLIITSNKYEGDIARLEIENKKLEYRNKELMASVEALQTQLNNAYDIECEWYEDFYYEHSSEVGAYE